MFDMRLCDPLRLRLLLSVLCCVVELRAEQRNCASEGKHTLPQEVTSEGRHHADTYSDQDPGGCVAYVLAAFALRVRTKLIPTTTAAG